MPEYNQEIAATLLKRVAIREKISESLISGKESLRVVIERAKSGAVNDLEIELVAKRLATEDFLAAENINNFAKKINAAVSKEFPNEGITLVVLGSGVHGGHEIRKLLGSSSESDIDLGVIFGSNVNPDQKDSLSSKLTSFIKEWVSEHHGDGEPDHLCTVVNPRVYNTIDLKDDEDIFNRLTGISKKNASLSLVSEITLLLYPSVPSETNARNKHLTSRALKRLYEQSPDLWHNVVSNLKEVWGEYHQIKSKHLVGSMTDEYYQSKPNVYDTNSYKIIERTRKQLYNIMQKPFSDFLESSKD